MTDLNETLSAIVDERDRLKAVNADLLAALKNIMAMGFDDRIDIWDQAAAAIAKAESKE